MARRFGAWPGFVLVLGSTISAAACAPHAGSDNPGTFSTGGTNSSPGESGGRGGSGNKTGRGATASQDPGSGGVVIGPIPTQMPPSLTPDSGCAKTSATAEQNVITKTITTQDPVALFLVQDRSGSMRETPQGATQAKWDQAVAAVNGFVSDPNSSNMDVALGFFPMPNGDCAGVNYSTPYVPLTRLPSAKMVQDVANALTTNAPGGGGRGGPAGSTMTPIEGALRGGENYCLMYQAQNPAEKCVVVLITDGAPTSCDQSPATLSGIAADAHSRGVLTFAIGMDGADFGLLDQIATSGGSSCGATPACNVNNGSTSFRAALEKIRTTVTKTTTTVQNSKLACQYSIPAPMNGDKLDPKLVNVQITKDGATQKLGQVPDATSCQQYGGKGWYYDDNLTPKSVNFCPDTCHSLEAPDAGLPAGTTAPKVDVVFGCATEPAIPA